MKRSLLLITCVLASTSIASADREKSCPIAGEVLVNNICIKLQVAPRDPAVAQYQDALVALDTNPKHAFALFEAACNKRGHGPSCTQLGRMYEFSRGRVVPKSLPRAMELYEQACTRGDGAGCRLLGTGEVNNSNGLTDQAALSTARKYLTLACAKQEPFGCSLLGKLLEAEYGGPPDPKRAAQTFDKAKKLFDKRCPTDNRKAKRDGEACWQLGHVLTAGWHGTKDPVRARRAYELACEANHGFGCHNLIDMLRASGKTVADLIDLHRKACRLDIASSCRAAGYELVNRDRGKSTEPAALGKLACDLDPKECGLWGELHRLGWAGVPKDEGKATEIYKSACDAGDHGWCMTYANRLRAGTGIKADPTAANAILQKACDAKEAAACNSLARALFESKTDADDARAFALAQTGCRLKNMDACLAAAWQIEQNRRGGSPVAEKADRVKEAITFYETVCTNGVAVGCKLAGDRYLDGVGVPKDIEKAMARYRTGCDAAVPSGDACYEIAVLLSEGKLVPSDRKGAYKGAARACARDVAHGCDWVGGAVADADDIKMVVGELTAHCPRIERACVTMANVLFRGTTADKTRANELLTASCGRKHYPACIRAAVALWYGEGGDVDKVKAQKMLARHCDDNDGQSCSEAAIMAHEQKDGEAVVRYASRGCTQLKHAESCVTLAFTYYIGTKPVVADIDAAIKYGTQACELGSMLGCSNLALAYRFGTGVAKDPKRAYELYTKACEGGVSFACAGQARYIYTGEGGAKKDIGVAIETYRKSCEDRRQPAPLGCVELADALEIQRKASASEISAFRDKGLKLVKKAAELNPNYMFWMGVFYRDGSAVAKDPAEARKWFVAACEHNEPLGCNAVGQMLATSANPTDRDKAREYFGHACAVRLDEACKGIEALKAAPAPVDVKPTTPGVVKAKACGCGSAADAGLPLLVLALWGCGRRRRHSRRCAA